MSVASKNKIAFRLLALVFFMLAMSFAAVPFYDWFCRVTGFGGVTQTAVDESDKILERNITVRFDGSLDSNIDWEFKPTQRKMTLRIGETGLAFYEAHNPTDKVIAGTASFNVYPYSAGYYFNKIQCFCFEMQVLQPGETVQMPVTFYVDPEIIDDREAKFVNNITLSYTFHATDLPTDQASLASSVQSTVNKPES
ncbi:MAG: cytochrome c oxidase assembly protein [Amylibacter sp.]|nr:cytochrome c oxidase assembly protein [Amylibacter sp.]MDA8803018.1 cytochrome c oxidase assembly protein [Amylibacter sp.]MDG1947657.1 cytochrome c oxidase assembly protein [Amylibacter sp.]MDG2401767.1 cytochrome c oxidase assembly protein [Amylibacter sp.]RZO42990.1 MAG: cytochrome c oxidase assembly protein [Paracoccaceae bacterium]